MYEFTNEIYWVVFNCYVAENNNNNNHTKKEKHQSIEEEVVKHNSVGLRAGGNVKTVVGSRVCTQTFILGVTAMASLSGAFSSRYILSNLCSLLSRFHLLSIVYYFRIMSPGYVTILKA